MLTAEQLALRHRGLGASEIPAVCGLNPWQSPLDVWLLKTGRAEPFDGNTRTELGNILEPHIVQWWAKERGITETRKCETLFDREHEWLFATPDTEGVDELGKILCEAKLVGFRVRDQWRHNTLPDYVTSQVQIQQRVTGVHRAEVAAWIDGDSEPRRIVPCHYDVELASALIEIAREFWFEYVRKDIQPPVDASDSWAEYIAKLYPSDKLPVVEAPKGAEDLCRKYLAAHAAEKAAKSQKEQAEHELKLLIGERGGLARGRRELVTWLKDSVGRVSWKEVAHELGKNVSAKEFAALVDANTGEPSRRFLVKEI